MKSSEHCTLCCWPGRTEKVKEKIEKMELSKLTLLSLDEHQASIKTNMRDNCRFLLKKSFARKEEKRQRSIKSVESKGIAGKNRVKEI
jgi:hypothetical protein